MATTKQKQIRKSMTVEQKLKTLYPAANHVV